MQKRGGMGNILFIDASSNTIASYTYDAQGRVIQTVPLIGIFIPEFDGCPFFLIAKKNLN